MIYSILFFYSMIFFYLIFSLLLIGLTEYFPGVWTINVFVFLFLLPKLLVTSIVYLVLFIIFGRSIKKTFIFFIATICLSILFKYVIYKILSSSNFFYDRVFFVFL